MPLTKHDFINYKYGNGEMLPYERYKLHTWVKQCGCKNVLEIGTGNGTSTYYIAQALFENNNNGIIVTCDPIAVILSNILNDYNNIKYNNITSTELIKALIEAHQLPDFIFFDGPEIEELALVDIQTLEPHIKPGCYFSMHDWEFNRRNYDNSISIKSKLIRPYIENSKRWEKQEVLSGMQLNSDYFVYQNLNCDSVGLCLYKFLG